MPGTEPAGTPADLTGRRLRLTPLLPGDAARALLEELAPVIAPGRPTSTFVESTLATMAFATCDAWSIHRADGPALGLAWLLRDHRRRLPDFPSVTAGLAWLPGRRVPSRAVAEVFLLVLGVAFDRRGSWSVTPWQPAEDGPIPRAAPLLRGEWPALRASLEARLGG